MNLNITDDIITEATSLFFQYQYSQCMFIWYEAFLDDYCENRYGGRYWSYPLLYSICALGATMSSEAEVKGKGDLLFQVAREMLDNQGLHPPNITAIQAYLCLAFYEMGRGNHSRSWLLSGMLCNNTSAMTDIDILRHGSSYGARFRIAPGPQILGQRRCHHQQ